MSERPVEQTASMETAGGRDGVAPIRTDGSTNVPLSASDPAARPNATSPMSAAEAKSAREQRYNELLRSGPPPSPLAAQKQEEPSLLQRVVTPIANVLGLGNRPSTSTAPLRAPQQQAQRLGQQQQQQQPKDQQPQEGRPGEQPKNDPQENDPDADTQPPTLIAADFTPPQVQDGEETVFAAIVNDNRSGVRSVSGVIASPSGALQGFACQREAESNRYVARVTVPRDAAEGLWAVKYLTLSDNASNSVNLNAAQGALPMTASFRVSSRQSDSTGPTLKSVWIDKTSMTAGDRNTVFVQAEDDKSGVALVSGVFVSPAKAARIGFGCRVGSGGTWECPLTPPSCIDCGMWTLEQIQLQDKANNMVTFRGDNAIVKGVNVQISGDHCDATPPDLSSLTLDPPSVSNVDGGVITVTAIINDEGCGVASLSGQSVPPGNVGGGRLYFSLDAQPDGKTFIGKITVPQLAAKGTWTIAWLQALDKAHNLKAYSATDPVVSRATFRVE